MGERSKTPVSEEFPLRVGIIGSGPAGLYAADALLKSKTPLRIDILDALPTPYGLVRSGVAPDHHKIKEVTRLFEKTLEKPEVRFLGNIAVGRDVSVAELKYFYDAIILSHGSETDRTLGVSGENLPGCFAATDFVGWYNAHPRFASKSFPLSAERVAIIGQGNVAVDVARILAKTPDELRETDIANYALETLAESSVRHIYLIGRRGPVQAAFTDKEVKELGELEDCNVLVDPAELILSETDEAELAASPKGTLRNIEILREFSTRTPQPQKKKNLYIVFYRGPVEFVGTEQLSHIRLEKNILQGKAGEQKAVGTGEFETLAVDLVFKSVGYKGVPFPELPFDPKSGTYLHLKGRIISPESTYSGLYTAGWIKRGPSGVIGTNKADSAETVATLLADMPHLNRAAELAPEAVLEFLIQDKGLRPVSFSEWKVLDAIEQETGMAKGKPREKFRTVQEMLDALPSRSDLSL